MARVNETKITLLLVDCRAAINDDLHVFLAAQPDMDVLGCISSGEAVMDSVRQISPVVVVVLSGESLFGGVESSVRIRMQHPNVKVVMVSSALSPGHLMLALEAGVHGYVVADAGHQAVANAVRAALVGATYLSSEATDTLVADYLQRTGADGATGFRRLSKREREVFQRLVDGESASSIARDLGLSPKTVDTYRRRLMQKLGVTSTPALVKLALKHGLTVAT